MSQALEDIAAERRRQIEREGWTAEHDDAHDGGELSRAAACYAHNAGASDDIRAKARTTPIWMWPWRRAWWKPEDRRRDLVKAGALILAEIERLDRAAAK